MSDAAVDKQSYWQSSKKLIDQLVEVGAQDYLAQHPKIDKAFSGNDRVLRCMDEGTPGGVHLGGSGILLNMDEAIKMAKAAGVTAVCSHDQCGAAKLYAQKEDLYLETSDEYGREWAKALASNLGVPYRGHIEIDQMHRPSGLHTAVAVYYDGTGQFNYAEADLPSGFIISRRYLSSDYAQKELEIALSIAFGDHGFGELFTASQPFHVIVLASDEGEAEKLKMEAAAVAALYGNRVRIDHYCLQN